MPISPALFDVDTILKGLQEEPPVKNEEAPSTLKIWQQKLKEHYFGNRGMANDQALEKLESPGFNEFPRLKYVLQNVFRDNSNIQVPDELKDWEPGALFAALNAKYGYFDSNDSNLPPLFHDLAIVCRKMTSIIEQQAPDDEMAYKLMALFYDTSKDKQQNFELIPKKFNSLIMTKQDRVIQNPYHDAFVTDLGHFPEFERVQNFPGWQKFINSQGFNSLTIFTQCADRVPFHDLAEAKDFLLHQTYPRAKENTGLAKLCKSMLISNEGFEAGLTQVQSGWPKKEKDHLPRVDIADSTGQFFWVKLPPTDMRAMYLGNLIPGCCQFINGHSRQCVIDGMCLADNGFYVLLKAKPKGGGAPRVKGHEINDQDFSIVAVSYAWISKNGNLCLDSLEWNKDRITRNVIQDLMSKFSDTVFAERPDIKYITVGKGGKTPEGIYPACTIHETMRQGHMYRDARQQYQVASQITPDALSALKERLQSYSRDYQEVVEYLAPYFDDIQNIPEALLADNQQLVGQLPKLIKRINLPPTLSASDFANISFVKYQAMDTSQQARVSTVCKLLNSPNQISLEEWLPTIPKQEMHLISLINPDYSLQFRASVIARLPQEIRFQAVTEKNSESDCLLLEVANNPQLLNLILTNLNPRQHLEALKEKDSGGRTLLYYSYLNGRSFEMVLALYPDEKARVEAFKAKDSLGRSVLSYAASKPESLAITLKHTQPEQRLEAVTEEDYLGRSVLSYAASNPESLAMILKHLQPEQRLEAVTKKDSQGRSVLLAAIQQPELLAIILQNFKPEQCLQILKEKDSQGRSVLFTTASNPKLLAITIEHLKLEQNLQIVTEKNSDGQTLLFNAASNTESLKMILALYPDEKARLGVIKEKDSDGTPFLFRVASNTESLKMILALYPDEKARLEAVEEKRSNYANLLMYAVSYPESLKMMLALYPDEKARLVAVKEKCRDSLELLINAVSYPESLKLILALYPNEQERLEAVKAKESDGDSVIFEAVREFYMAASKCESLKMILALYPGQERLEAVKAKDSKGHSVLSYASRNPESLAIILKHLLPEQRLEALKEKDRDGDSIFFKAAKNNVFLSIILTLLKPEQRLEALKEKSNLGRSVLLSAASRPKAIRIIQDLLPEEIALVLKVRELDLPHNPDDVLDSASSIEEFMHSMHELAEPQSIKAFIHSMIKNENIEEAKQSLLAIKAKAPGSDFFRPANNNIQALIDKLHPFWQARIGGSQDTCVNRTLRNLP